MDPKTKRTQLLKYITFLLLALLLSLFISASLGAADIPLSTTAAVFLSRLPFLSRVADATKVDSAAEVILLQIRLPRIVLAMVVGAALATAGVIFQALFRNPMADSWIIGVSPGAALGATIAIVFKIGHGMIGLSALSLLAFLGAMGTTLFVYRIARTGTAVPVANLLLSGIAAGAFLSALVSLLMMIGQEDLHRIFFWMLGGFTGASWDRVILVLPFVLVCVVVVLFFSRDLNLFLLGEERASQLGMETEKVKLILILLASLIASLAVSVSGIIGFVGLITPHTVRLVTGPDHRLLTPTSALAGALIMLVSDTFARLALSPREIPVGVITAMIGAPFFIYLLRSRKRGLVR